MPLIDAVNLFGESRLLPGVPQGNPDAIAFLMPLNFAFLNPGYRGILSPASYRLVAFGSFDPLAVYRYAQEQGSSATLADIESLVGQAGAVVGSNGTVTQVTLVQNINDLVNLWKGQPVLYPYQTLVPSQLP